MPGKRSRIDGMCRALGLEAWLKGALEAGVRAVEQVKLPQGGRLLWVDADGVVVRGDGGADAEQYRWLVAESLRWGEPYFRWLPDGCFCVTLPLTVNHAVLGGLVLELAFGEEEQDRMLTGLRLLGTRLADLLEEAGLLNGALMRERAAVHARERLRAEAMHDTKREPLGQLRAIYLRLEPELFLAMQRGERREARRILNQVLMGIYSFGKEEVAEVKGYFLDLLTSMSRMLVDCGAEPAAVFGQEYGELRTLQQIEDEEDLGHWIAEVLERLIDTVENVQTQGMAARLQPVLRYLREHCDKPLGRDEVARMAGLSPSHFSRQLKAVTGHSFTEELQRMRVARGARLLRGSQMGVLEIALECGFQDQSHFSKVFRRYHGVPPTVFRRAGRKSTKRPNKGLK